MVVDNDVRERMHDEHADGARKHLAAVRDLVVGNDVAVRSLFDRRVRVNPDAFHAASAHVGTVGERLRGVEAVVEFVRDLDGGMYGPKRLVKLRAGDDVLVTFSTSEWVWSAKRGQQVVLDFTVKAHDRYEGTAQTTITRAKAKQVEA